MSDNLLITPHSTESFCREKYMLDIMKTSNTIHQRVLHGFNKNHDDLCKLISSMGAVILDSSGKYEIVLVVHNKHRAQICLRIDPTDDETYITLTGISRKFIDTLSNSLEGQLTQKRDPGLFTALVQSASGMSLTSIGRSSCSIERGNYTLNVNNDFDHVVACLHSNNPCGSLILLEGSPGTGKSFLLRALSDELSDATFVVVSAGLIGQLSGPAVLPVLLNEKSRQRKVILVLEDADKALIHRSRESNHVALSEILNLGDGLLGELCDIRVIATTNAKRIHLDSAITRPGRMCRHITLQELNQDHSRKIYQRLTGDSPKEGFNARTLADVYRLARLDGWVPNPDAQKTGQYL